MSARPLRYFRAGRLIGRHLAELDHRRVAFFGGPRESLDTRRRLRGLSEALAERGVTIREADVGFASSYTPEAGIAFATRFLADRPAKRATAVVLGNDVMALGFIRTLLQSRVQVPRDVSVAGFDGIAEGALCWPGLTTVVQPTRRMAARACQALLDRIEGRGEKRPVSLEFGVELVVRESTARAALGDRSRRGALVPAASRPQGS